ncbi:MAG TPA: hypothetical protein VHS97_22315 [Isosphaeraceae bacterium]|nr:hypothetical protein [Isosphaeraceae bacterium]
MSTQTAHPDAKDQKDNVHDTPNEYPFVLYNHKTRQTKLAKDKDEYDKLSKAGFEEDPLEPEDPDMLTQDEMKLLRQLFAKAANALEKLARLSQSDDKGNDKAQTAAGQKETAAHRK